MIVYFPSQSSVFSDSNEAALKSGDKHIFLQNVTDCGQRREELWLCANGGIKVRGMIRRGKGLSLLLSSNTVGQQKNK